MNLDLSKTEEYNDLLKSRVEVLRLSNRTKKALINAGIRTVGGIIRRGLENLCDIDGLGLKGQREIGNLPIFHEDLKNNVDNNILEVVQVENVDDMSVDVEKSNGLFAQFKDEDDIIAILANHFGYTREIIDSHTRKQEIVFARDMIIYMLREYADMSYPMIGRLIGGRDHTTIIHAHKKIKKLLETRRIVALEAEDLINKVRSIKEKKHHIENSLIPNIIATIGDSEGLHGLSLVFKEIPERNTKILEMYREGLTLKNISDVIGITRERVRQVAISTIKQIAINESISRGIDMDTGVLMEEESRKRQEAKDSKRPKKMPVQPHEYRWSRYYVACKSCGTTALPHVRSGLCEQCVGQFRGDRRENIVLEHNNKCDSCGRTRSDAVASLGRDFYITKDKRVLCRECFTRDTGKLLGSYKNFEWSRFHEKCIKCGTTSVPHVNKGLCENCADIFTLQYKHKIITDSGGKCTNCGISRIDAKDRYGQDLYVTKSRNVLCKVCFQKQNIKRLARHKKLV